MSKQVESKGSFGSKPKVNWSREVMASVVVFLVALPLCMGIAIASGVPPALGLISGIVGGLVVGSLAGAPLQVSGPAAGLAVIVWELVKTHGLPALGVVVLMAGLLQLLAGWLKLGRWFRAVSPAVIHGMLAGIGVLILGSQFHVMVDDKPRGGGLANLLSIPEAIYKGLFPITGSQHHLAATIGVVTILTLVLWSLFRPKKLSFLPASLLAVIVAVLGAYFFSLPIKYISVPSNLLKAANFPTWSGFVGMFSNAALLLAALAFALVASAESLLCAVATDKLHSEKRADFDRELMAQGVGNMVCGLFGALPVTGVIVRSSANIEAGAKSRASGIFHGFWLLAFVVALPFVIQLIPKASLAAILVYIGYKLVNFKVMRELWDSSRSELGIYLVTVASIVSIDLLSGVLIGVGLSLLKLLYAFSRLDIEVIEGENNRYDLSIEGSATFIKLPILAETLENLPMNAEVHIHTGRLNYIDHACIELLGSWADQMKSVGGELVVEWDILEKRFKGETASNEKNQSASLPSPLEHQTSS